RGIASSRSSSFEGAITQGVAAKQVELQPRRPACSRANEDVLARLARCPAEDADVAREHRRCPGEGGGSSAMGPGMTVGQFGAFFGFGLKPPIMLTTPLRLIIRVESTII